MKARLAVDALGSAAARRRTAGDEVAGCMVHSDRGSQFRSRKFVRALGNHGMVGSMGRVGACGDNVAMESFFALLQRNVLDTYHRCRRQARLGKLTPIEYEAIMAKPALRAA